MTRNENMDNLCFDYAKFEKEIFVLKTRHPDISLIKAAKSRMGRDIFALCAGNPVGANIITGGFSGSDILSVKTVMIFAKRYFSALFSENQNEMCEINIKKAAAERGAIFIPCINPDGAEIFSKGISYGPDWLKKSAPFIGDKAADYRANAAGVEIERNFDYDFENRRKKERLYNLAVKSPSNYSGKKAFSEPESAGLRDLLKKCRPNLICNLSSGNGEILWRGVRPHKNAQRIAGVLCSLCGYALEADIGPLSEGIFRSWASVNLGVPSIDIKVKRPSRFAGFERIYAELEEALAVASVI